MTTTPATPVLDLALPERPSLLGDAWRELRGLARYRALLRTLVSSSLRKDNANTVLGVVWWVLDPLLLCAIYVILVQVILGRGGPDFAIFVLTAIILYELFTKSVTMAVGTTLAKARSMREIAFPKTALPLSSVLVAAFNLLFAFAVLVVVAVPFGIYPSAYLLLAIPIVAVELVFILGVALFLSALNIFFRDIAKLIRYVFRIGFYLSPALYPLSRVPDQFRPIYDLNPFATLFTEMRAVVMYQQLPDFGALAVLGGVSLVLLAAGFLFFIRVQPWFVKLV